MTPEAALADVAGIGAFFAVTPEPRPAWPALSALLTGPLLADRVAATRAALAASAGRPVEARVAASVTQLGLAARLLSPLLAVAVLHGLVLRPDPELVRWRPGLGRPVPLAVPPGAVTAVPAGPTVDDLAAGLATGVLAPLVAPLVQRSAPLAPALLWGNAASAVAGAAATVAAARPAAAPAARALTAALLARPPLAGTGTLAAGRFRRRSCCLLYRAGSPLCGDCALARR